MKGEDLDSSLAKNRKSPKEFFKSGRIIINSSQVVIRKLGLSIST